METRPRDREATERRLTDAVETLLAREGFAALGVRAVAREAAVDHVLIGRYFGDLDGLLEVYATSARHWPTAAEVTRGVDPGAPLAARLGAILGAFADALARRPVTCEVLAWEAAQRSRLTDILDRSRQAWVGEIATTHLPELIDGPDASRIEALTSLLGAAIHYVAIRNRNAGADWGGLGVRNDAGRERLKAVVAEICRAVLEAPGDGAGLV